MANIWQVNGGIPVGYAMESVESELPPLGRPTRYADDRHVVLVGPNGSGKTKRLLVPALYDLTDWSMVVVDPKGELCAMTRAHREAAGNRIVILNPFNVLGLGSTGFNPIDALELDDDFPDDALELAEAIIRLEGKEPHWTQAAQELVAALIMYVKLVFESGGNFADVRALLSQDVLRYRAMISSAEFEYDGLEVLGIKPLAEKTGWKEMLNKANRYADINPENREMLSVISTALTQTRWLDSRKVSADLASKEKIDFSEMKEKPWTVYLILPARRLVTHSTWLRLMIASVVQKLMKDTTPAKVPVLLMLDEYFGLAEGDGFPVIKRNMAMFRGYGIKLWTVWQDLNQAKELYGDGFETFLGNAGIVQTFAPQDVMTAEFFSRMAGQMVRRLESVAEQLSPNPLAPGGVQRTSSRTLGSSVLPRHYAQEIRGMPEGVSLIFTHKKKGPVVAYVPWPEELPHLRPIMALDPNRS